ncbi:MULTISPECIES: TRAP transporter small permease subunit [Neptunomonas]|uniref:TRAP transporter small permease protein n=1 Tax=Neptunomonas marina TaxID=1815562 RepID=A0A437QCF9_9GAMM|nr:MULTISPECIES: TRAP transporter small permease [Neptunomonas]RVU32238.1 TRAP transporter small permease [Neptunomonas marina]
MFTSTLRLYCTAVQRLVAFIGRGVSILMPMIALVIAFEVFARYFLNKPTIWAYDLSLFLSGYLAALGGAYAQQRKAHINVDILYLSVSANVKRIFHLVSGALAIFFMAVVVLVSIDKFNEALNFNYRRMSEWAPPMHHFWMMLIVACSLLILQIISDIINDLYHLVTGRDLVPVSDEDAEDDNGN